MWQCILFYIYLCKHMHRIFRSKDIIGQLKNIKGHHYTAQNSYFLEFFANTVYGGNLLDNFPKKMPILSYRGIRLINLCN